MKHKVFVLFSHCKIKKSKAKNVKKDFKFLGDKGKAVKIGWWV